MLSSHFSFGKLRSKLHFPLLLPLLLFPCLLWAQELSSPQIWVQQLEWLRNGAQGLCALSVAAHPDDEDGPTLAWLRAHGVETHMCIVTRGEGGQNETGPELDAQLGVLRTHETRAAAAILNAHYWCLNLPDFGYSKSKTETFAVWDYNLALERLVKLIRTVQPELIFTNHDPEGNEHGHHQATGQLVYDAFDKAGDPAVFPEQLAAGLHVWKPFKLYRRLFAPKGATVALDIGSRDPLLGFSPLERAALALQQHRSQGMQLQYRLGERRQHYLVQVKSLLSMPEHSDLTKLQEQGLLSGFEKLNIDLPDESRYLQLCLHERQVELLRYLSDLLLTFRAATETEITPSLQARYRRCARSLEYLLATAIALQLQIVPSEPIVTADEPVELQLRILHESAIPLVDIEPVLKGDPGWRVAEIGATEKMLSKNELLQLQIVLNATQAAYPSYPEEKYLLARMQQSKPLTLKLRYRLRLEDKTIPLESMPYEVPLHLAPPFEAFFTESPKLLFDDPDTPDQRPLLCETRLKVTSYRRTPWKLFARIADDPRIKVRMEKDAIFDFTRPGQSISADFRFMIAAGSFGPRPLKLPTVLWTTDHRFPHAPEAQFVRIPLRLPRPLHIGVVRTYDQATWQSLQLLAQKHPDIVVAELSADDLRDGNLNAFHTIVLDLRATQYRPEVVAYRERLHAFMNEGGHLVCFYHKDFDWNSAEDRARGRGFLKGQSNGGSIAPFPLQLSFRRITDEAAPVQILLPEHRLLSRPCKIWERDFANWVQERGVYFPESWDSRYSALLSSHDPGEKALDGGLLFTEVGKGSFVYTSYVWYRQLRAGVPGAYRMLANLVSYPRVRDWQD